MPIKILTNRLTECELPQTIPPSTLPGPTGESNQLYLHPKAPILCLGPGPKVSDEQAAQIRKRGGLQLPSAAILNRQH